MTRELLNTLFVLTPHAFVRLHGDAVKVTADGETRLTVPLHHLGAIHLFGAASASLPLLARCAADGRTVCSFDTSGRFQFRVVGPVCGNVLLRQAQYEVHRKELSATPIARAFVAGKIRNARQILLRFARDSKDPESVARLRQAAEEMASLLLSLPGQPDRDGVRGVEGQAAAVWFAHFPELITAPTAHFSFATRTRRPPRDRVNALLSFLYALLTADCEAACEGVGLDPQFGFLHAVRPGRPALALDLMEEFRPVLVDRLALNLMNRKQIRPEHFEERQPDTPAIAEELTAVPFAPVGAVLLNDVGRKTVLAAYHERKQEEAIHPFLKDKVPLGLLPHLQARLLARHLRGDLADYVPYLMA